MMGLGTKVRSLVELVIAYFLERPDREEIPGNI
jgi:hypothetical protein